MVLSNKLKKGGIYMDKIFNTELIDKYLEENKLTKTKFAKMCGISYSSLLSIYNNRTDIYIVTLYKVVRKIKIELCQIFVD